METEIVLSGENKVKEGGVFNNMVLFSDAQRVAQALMKSDIIPERYRNNISNCLIALEMASRMNKSPLMIMQNLYVVHGTPGWSSQFIIACINSSGKYSSLKAEYFGQENTDTWGCKCYAIDLATNEVTHGPSVTIAMAKSEGWLQKNGSKWKTLPELMLHYRAATFFGRLYCPEVLMGYQTIEEVVDISASKPVRTSASSLDLPKTEPIEAEKTIWDFTGRPEERIEASKTPELVAIFDQNKLSISEMLEALNIDGISNIKNGDLVRISAYINSAVIEG